MSPHWITADNTYALVDATERDRLTPLGWAPAPEPQPDEFVWMRKDGIEQPGRFAYQAVPHWRRTGWELSGPPERVDPTKDPLPPEPAAAEPTTPAAGKAAATKSTKE